MILLIHSKFQWASALSSAKGNSEIAHLLMLVAILETPLQIGADGTLASASSKVQQFFNITA